MLIYIKLIQIYIINKLYFNIYTLFIYILIKFKNYYIIHLYYSLIQKSFEIKVRISFIYIIKYIGIII